MEYLSRFEFFTLKTGLYLILLASVVNSETQERMSSLYSDLLNKYNTNTVPRNNMEPIKVNITFNLMSLIRFDETEETLLSAAWLSMSWQDHFLTWPENPEYENITDIYLTQKEIWKPDIVIINTVEDYELLGSDDRLVEVTSEGDILWEPGHRFKTACSPNINHYPFDTQECILKFSTWTHVSSVVILQTDVDEIFLDEFEENGEWEIISSSAKCTVLDAGDYSIPQFLVTLTLKRRRTYYVLTVCIPIIVLSFLNCLVYLLPPESGEKMSFCLTTLLTYMVYISFLSNSLPKTSKTTSYLLVYLSLMIGLSFLSVLNSVIVLLLWHKLDRDDDVDGDHQERRDEKVDPASEKNVTWAKTVDITKYILCKRSQVHPLVGEKEGQSKDEKYEETIRLDWKTIAKRFDTVLLICVSVLTVIATIVIMALLLIQ